jgi:hypothetical protein
MKPILLITSIFFLLTSCNTSRNYLSRVDEDKTLFDIVKRLNRRNSDADATKALPEVYTRVQQKHLKKIATYKTYKDIAQLDKLVDEYSTLQKMYEVISRSNAASQLVTAINYQDDLYAVKQDAAEAYYQQGENFLAGSTREDAKKAYEYFKKADDCVPGFKDARSKKEAAYQNAIINVVISPVKDNSFFFNTGWGNTGYNYSNEYFQQTLIRELGGNYTSRYPARFYTDWEARRENIKPDWVIDLTLRNMDIPIPTTYNYSRNVSQQVEAGKDTSGRIIYKTVYATIQIAKESFTAYGQMDVDITDVYTRRNISYNTYREDYKWEEERATYTGDSRALSSSDWALINNNGGSNQPRREEVLNELYRKIYPRVISRIRFAVDW